MRESKDKAIERIMAGLKCSMEEAEQVYNYDKAIDHGEKTDYDLPPEKEQIARKFAHTGTRKAPTVYRFDRKERKPNAAKGAIIAGLETFLSKDPGFSVDSIEVTNKERQIIFTSGGETFELTLVQKRKPKT